MVTEDKIGKLQELIQLIPGSGRKNYALKIVNELIDSYNSIEKQNDALKAKRLNVSADKYDTYIEKCADIISILGFDDVDMFEFDKRAIVFIRKNRTNIKKQLTPEYLLTLNNLFKFFVITEDREPESLKELADAYTEIEANRAE